MSLGSDLAAALPGLRAEAESRMRDTVRIYRETPGEGTDENGNPVVVTAEIYGGPARLLLSSSVVRDVDAQSQLLAVQSPRLDIPVVTPATATGSTADVKAGDRFVILASETEDSLVDLEPGKVAGIFPHSQSTARRLPVEVWS